MSLCLAAGKLLVVLAAPSFTLAWMHSIEKIRWEEDYRIRDHQLEAVAARVLGSGAGMEPPEEAVYRDGRWHYRPPIALHRELRLARSAFTPDYELCIDGQCRPLAHYIPVQEGTTRITACDRAPGRHPAAPSANGH